MPIIIFFSISKSDAHLKSIDFTIYQCYIKNPNLDKEKKVTDKAHPTLYQIQRMFFRIYAKHNAMIYGAPNVLLRVFEETAAIAELFRKESLNNIPHAFAGLFGWIIGFCNSHGIDLARATFNKYHGACPNCGQELHCVCISAETKPEKWLEKPDAKMPMSLPEWQKMFENIYGRVNRVAGRDKCWQHILEELGEISRAARINIRKDLEDELADSFAWICAFCNTFGFDLEQAVLARYPEACDRCKQKRCICPRE